MTMKHLVLPAITTMLLAGAPSMALAHAFLDNATPKVGSTVNAPPASIRIQFTQKVEAAFSHIHLIGADGKDVAMGAPTTDPNDQTQLIAPVTGKLAPGRYEVRWDVLSVDTHHTNGHFPFTFQP
jgi:methionine-rich copper-binding protein CopC